MTNTAPAVTPLDIICTAMRAMRIEGFDDDGIFRVCYALEGLLMPELQAEIARDRAADRDADPDGVEN